MKRIIYSSEVLDRVLPQPPVASGAPFTYSIESIQMVAQLLGIFTDWRIFVDDLNRMVGKDLPGFGWKVERIEHFKWRFTRL